MPLHHWPNPRVPWRSFHIHWIVRLVEHLNRGALPPGFQARPTEFIVGIEPDVLLLQDGVHLTVIDVISLPQQPMRQPILERLGLAAAASDPGLWLSSYCSIPEDSPRPHFTIKEWASQTALNTPLPTLPLFLQTDQQYVMVDLEQTYQETLAAGRYRPT
jgi:hypothetical protein